MEQGDCQILLRCDIILYRLYDVTQSLVGKDYMNATWLFAEAYKYRRLRECFSVSKFWKDYDVFFRQKVRAILSVPYSSPELFAAVRHLLSLERRCI